MARRSACGIDAPLALTFLLSIPPSVLYGLGVSFYQDVAFGFWGERRV
jgi:hypothetical protein